MENDKIWILTPLSQVQVRYLGGRRKPAPVGWVEIQHRLLSRKRNKSQTMYTVYHISRSVKFLAVLSKCWAAVFGKHKELFQCNLSEQFERIASWVIYEYISWPLASRQWLALGIVPWAQSLWKYYIKTQRLTSMNIYFQGRQRNRVRRNSQRKRQTRDQKKAIKRERETDRLSSQCHRRRYHLHKMKTVIKVRRLWGVVLPLKPD